MAISKVSDIGSVAVSGGGGATITIPVGAGGVGAGHDIVVTGMAGAISTNITGWSCTDTAGNTYTVDLIAVRAGSAFGDVIGFVIRATGVTALSNGNSITVTMPVTNAYQFAVATEFSFAGTSAKDVSAIATNTSTAPASGTTGATGTASELAIGFVAWGNAASATETISGVSAGYIALVSSQSASGTARAGVFPYYQILSGTGTQSFAATMGNSDDWVCGVVTYKAVPAYTGAGLPDGQSGQSQMQQLLAQG